ncbi:tetraspanin family protein [Wolffia australiana]
MGRTINLCLQSILKLANSVIGMVGIGMILYSLWMLRAWYNKTRGFWSEGPDSSSPWFIYTFLVLGVILCVIACSGHIAAETVNGPCISCYMVFVFLLIIAEAAITADVFLNKNWKEDFPRDPTGRLNEFKDFIDSNFDTCKWIGLTIVGSQGMAIIMAMVLRAMGPYREHDYDSDDDYIPARLPLLRNQQDIAYLSPTAQWKSR